MAEATSTPHAPAAPAKKGKLLGIVVLVLVCGGAIAGGYFASGYILQAVLPSDSAKKPSDKPEEAKIVYINIGEPIVANLTGENGKRFVRAKAVLVVDEFDENAVNQALAKKKPELRDWLLKHLSDQTVRSLEGAAGKNRIRREARDEFNAMLFPDGSEKVRDILWEEFNIQ